MFYVYSCPGFHLYVTADPEHKEPETYHGRSRDIALAVKYTDRQDAENARKESCREFGTQFYIGRVAD